ncbi:MAG: hypothetical protein MUP97_15740, partial [Acidimicrobiia bacterium]|nr:hypothetical protein [Acidimicrobiia bacterium]
ERLRALGIHGHVWERKELESYLLVPAAIARSSGAASDEVLRILDGATRKMKAKVFARVLSEEHKPADARRAPVPTTERVSETFDASWGDLD